MENGTPAGSPRKGSAPSAMNLGRIRRRCPGSPEAAAGGRPRRCPPSRSAWRGPHRPGDWWEPVGPPSFGAFLLLEDALQLVDRPRAKRGQVLASSESSSYIEDDLCPSEWTVHGGDVPVCRSWYPTPTSGGSIKRGRYSWSMSPALGGSSAASDRTSVRRRRAADERPRPAELLADPVPRPHDGGPLPSLDLSVLVDAHARTATRLVRPTSPARFRSCSSIDGSAAIGAEPR